MIIEELSQCVHCKKMFSIRNGEGWGRSYFKPGAILPSTIYECNDCINKGGEKNGN